MKKTIKLSDKVKKKLDKLKVHPRQPYDEVIEMLINRYYASREAFSREAFRND